MRSALYALFLVTLAAPAFASDGVIEINQTCAVETGCLTGDTAGFPVTIGESGSYRLTGDLVVPDASTSGISITTSDVTLDLSGFGLFGPTVCTLGASEVSCAPTGSGDGISDSSSDGTGTENVTVKNGTVRGFGRFGVSLAGSQGRIEDMRAHSNALNGLGVNAVPLSRGGSVLFSSSSLNGSDGIFLGSDGFARGNNTVANGRNGIRANERCTVVENTMTRNINTGLNVSSGSGYANNVISNNNGGNVNPQVSGTGVEMGGNVCGFNTTCP